MIVINRRKVIAACLEIVSEKNDWTCQFFCAGWIRKIMWRVLSVDLPNLWQTSVNGQSCSASLSTIWSLLIFNLISVVHGGEYMTVSRSSAIVNITYQNPLTDSMHSEVNRHSLLWHRFYHFLIENYYYIIYFVFILCHLC